MNQFTGKLVTSLPYNGKSQCKHYAVAQAGHESNSPERNLDRAAADAIIDIAPVFRSSSEETCIMRMVN
jgi:hypothetical protein